MDVILYNADSCQLGGWEMEQINRNKWETVHFHPNREGREDVGQWMKAGMSKRAAYQRSKISLHRFLSPGEKMVMLKIMYLNVLHGGLY